MCDPSAVQHLLTRLKAQAPTARIDTVCNAALESGGYYNQPRLGDNWSSQMIEIRAHNLFAEGSTDAEAIRNWMRVAENACRA